MHLYKRHVSAFWSLYISLKQAFTVRDLTGYENGLAFLLTGRLSRIAISNKLVKKELTNLQAKRA